MIAKSIHKVNDRSCVVVEYKYESCIQRVHNFIVMLSGNG